MSPAIFTIQLLSPQLIPPRQDIFGIMLEISDSAAEVLERAYEAAQRFNPDARVRIYKIANRIETGFADSAGPGEEVVEHQGMTLFVEKGIEGVLEVSLEHDRLIVR